MEADNCESSAELYRTQDCSASSVSMDDVSKMGRSVIAAYTRRPGSAQIPRSKRTGTRRIRRQSLDFHIPFPYPGPEVQKYAAIPILPSIPGPECTDLCEAQRHPWCLFLQPGCRKDGACPWGEVGHTALP